VWKDRGDTGSNRLSLDEGVVPDGDSRDIGDGVEGSCWKDAWCDPEVADPRLGFGLGGRYDRCREQRSHEEDSNIVFQMHRHLLDCESDSYPAMNRIDRRTVGADGLPEGEVVS